MDPTPKTHRTDTTTGDAPQQSQTAPMHVTLEVQDGTINTQAPALTK